MDDPEQGRTGFQRSILRAGLVFLGIVLLLTFFSRTILTLTLPRVEVEEPRSGALVREVHGEGLVTATEEVELYAGVRARVERVSVAPGDPVKAGQVLVVLNCGELQGELSAALASAASGASLDDALQAIASSHVKTLDGAVELASMQAQRLSTRVDTLRKLQAQGAESADTVNLALTELTQAQQSLREREEARDQERGRIIAELADALVIAPSDGIVAEVRTKKGGFADPLQPAVILRPKTAGLQVKIVLLPERSRYLEIGETVTVTSTTGDNRSAEGRLVSMTQDAKEATISLAWGSPFRAGDAVAISVQKLTQAYSLLVPNSAVGRDAQGFFVWVLKQRGGPLGDEYYVLQSHINTLDSDDLMTAVSSGLDPAEKVVIRSSKPLSGSGSRVALE